MSCEKAASCSTLPLWLGLDMVIDNYLENITLRDIIDGNMDRILPKGITMADYKESCRAKRRAAEEKMQGEM